MNKPLDWDTWNWTAQRLTAASYVFAKTMPQNPHYYTLRQSWPDADFAQVVRTMRSAGYVEYFRGKPYTMFNVNSYKYWTMGAPLHETILINRKPLTAPAIYDPLADVYDDLFDDDDSRAEEAAVFAQIPDGRRVLDLGCGSGLFLRYRQPESYTGLDPSARMLGQLQRHHRARDPFLVCARWEEFYTADRYDLIVALFGSASYIEPWALDRIPMLLAPGGRYFLMFYAPHYHPVTYQRSGIRLDHFDGHGAAQLGQVTPWGNYLIATGAAL